MMEAFTGRLFLSLAPGTLLGTPNRAPQEYNRNIMEYKGPGRYIPIIFLLYSWGFPIKSLYWHINCKTIEEFCRSEKKI